MARSGSRVPVLSLRVEHLRAPAVAVARVDQPLVEAALALVPELDALRYQPEARPVRRPRHRTIREARLDLAQPLVECARVLHRLALPRRPRAELAASRARREVRVRLLGAHRLGLTLDPHLALERLPVEAHRRFRMR